MSGREPQSPEVVANRLANWLEGDHPPARRALLEDAVYHLRSEERYAEEEGDWHYQDDAEELPSVGAFESREDAAWQAREELPKGANYQTFLVSRAVIHVSMREGGAA